MPEWAEDSTFPEPKIRTVKDGKQRNAHKFFEYCARLRPAKRDLISIKIYRLWPIVDLRAGDPKAKIEWDVLDGPLPFETMEYTAAFLSRYGSGEWKLILNEQGVSGKIMECYFTAIDMESYPPKLDPATLLRDSFRNRDYIRYLERESAAKGIALPWKTNLQEQSEQQAEQQAKEEEEMNPVVQQVLDQNKELVNELVNSKTREPGVLIESPTDVATKSAVGIVAEGAKIALTSMSQQIDRISEHSSKQHDPFEGLTRAMDLYEKISSRGTTEQAEMLKLLIAQQEKLMERLTTTPQQTALVPAEQPKSFVDQLREYKDIAELMGLNRRSSSVERSNPEPAASPQKGMLATMFESIAQNPQGALMAATALVSTIGALIKGGPPEPLPQQNGHAQQNGVMTAQPMMTQEQKLVADFMPGLDAHFSNFVEANPDSTSGYTFAEWIISDGIGAGPTKNGRQAYDFMKEKLFAVTPPVEGKPPEPPLFYKIIAQHFPQMMQKFSQTPAKTSMFFNQLLTYDAFIASQNEEETDDSKVPAAKAAHVQ